MHIFGFLAKIVIPSRQTSSLLLGWWHFTRGLQPSSHAGFAGAHTGLHAGAHTGLHTGAHTGLHTGAHTGLHTGSHTGLHTGCGLHTGAHTGWHGSGQICLDVSWQTCWRGGSQTGCVSQQVLLEQLTHKSAEAHKKSNEVNNPSCFLINRLL
jgi:hypothetical protein